MSDKGNGDVDAWAEAYERGEITLTEFSHRVDKALAVYPEVGEESFVQIGDVWRRDILSAIERGTDLTEIISPWAELNKILGVFEPTFLYVVGGDTSVGKSYLSLNIALKAAKDGFTVLYFSPEMGRRAMQCRVLSLASGMDTSLLMRAFRKRVESEFKERVKAEVDRYSALPIIIDCSPTLTIAEIQMRIQLLKPQLVVVDYIQRVFLEEAKDNIERETTGIMDGLVEAVRECEVPLIAVSQYNRGDRRKAGLEASIFAFRGSGAIEQVADTCMQIKRPEISQGEPYKVDGVTIPGYTEIVVTKNRNGPTGVVELVFKPKTGRFIAFTEEEGEQWV